MLAQQQPGELSRDLMFTMQGVSTFINPCWSGTPSPFEGTVWEHVEPPPVVPPRPELDRLRMSNFRLSIRLPRLICMVREIEEGCDELASCEAASIMLSHLTDLQDSAVESWLLHRVKVVRTADDMQGSAKIVPLSYEFRDLDEMAAGVCYWQNRVVLFRLSTTLRMHRNGFERNVQTHAETDEAVRCAKNIMMCWQYANGAGLAGRMVMTVALVIAWAALMDEDSIRGIPVPVFGKWILRRAGESGEGWIVGSTVADLTACSRIVCGGALEGPMADLMRVPNRSGRGTMAVVPTDVARHAIAD
jgi:hypothetical protein